jgi:CRP-like cAMP-binding protein
MIDVSMLGRIPFFSGLTAGDLRHISEICKIVTLKKGAKIFSRGDSAEHFYIVRSGKVHLSFQISILLAHVEIAVDMISAGDILGWSALVEPHRFTLSAYCDEDSELIEIGGKHMISMCAKRPRVGYILMRNLAKVIGSRMDRIQCLFEKELELNVPSFEGKRGR